MTVFGATPAFNRAAASSAIWICGSFAPWRRSCWTAPEYGHAAQHRTRRPVPADTRNFNPLPGTCTEESCPNLLVGGSLIPWHAEIRPIEHDVWPGRRPLRIQIQSEVGGRFAFLAVM